MKRKGYFITAMFFSFGIILGNGTTGTGANKTVISGSGQISRQSDAGFEMILQNGITERASDVVFSPCGEYVMAIDNSKSIVVYRRDGLLVRRMFDPDGGYMQFLTVSPDGKFIAYASGAHIRIRTLHDGKIIRTIYDGYSRPVFSPDSTMLLYGFSTVILYDIRSGNTIRKFYTNRSVHPEEKPTHAIFLPDGKKIVTVTSKRMVQLWDINGANLWTRTYVKKSAPGSLGSLLMDPLGITFASSSLACTKNGKFIIISTNPGVVIMDTNGEIKGGMGGKFTALFPDSIRIALADEQVTFIYIRDFSGKELKKIPLQKHANTSINCGLAVSPRGDLIALGGYDRISLIDPNSNMVHELKNRIGAVYQVTVSPDGHMYAAASGDGTVKLYSKDGRLLNTLYGHHASVEAVAFSPDGKYLASACRNGFILLWTSDGELIREIPPLKKYNYRINALAFSPDSSKIIAGSMVFILGYRKETIEDNSITIWTLDGKLVQTLKDGNQTKDFNGGIWRLAVNNKKNTIISAHFYDGIRIWSFSRMKKHIAMKGNVSDLAMSPDQRFFAAVVKKTLKLFDMDGDLIRDIDLGGLGGEQGRVAISPDGEYIATGTSRGALAIWHKNGSLVLTLSGHQDAIKALNFSPDGKYLVSGSSDTSTRFWRLDNGDSAATVALDRDWIIFTPDGYWDGSSKTGEFVMMVKGLAMFGVDQFALKYNRPDIIYERMGFGNREMIDLFGARYRNRLKKTGYAAAEGSVLHAPETKIMSKVQRGKYLTLNLAFSDTHAPLKYYSVYVNDVPVYGSGGKTIGGARIVRNETVELSSGRNKVEVSCTNTLGNESYRDTVYADYKAPARGNLYFIGFGVSSYRDTTLNLKYAHQDVLDLGKVFAGMKGRYNNVFVKTYTNEQVTVNTIKAAKGLLAGAKADDTFVLFIAGHGVHDSDKEATYYYLTHNTDINRLKETAANFDLIEDLMNGIAPRNKLFLMDTCESGEMEDDVFAQNIASGEKKGVKARTTRAITVKLKEMRRGKPRECLFQKDRYIFNDIARRSGAIVFSSSKGGELSYESDKYRNGHFTEEIVNALSGRADKNRDGRVSVDELREYVAKEVPRLSDGLQHPTVDRDNIYIKFGFPLVK